MAVPEAEAIMEVRAEGMVKLVSVGLLALAVLPIFQGIEGVPLLQVEVQIPQKQERLILWRLRHIIPGCVFQILR